MGVNDLYEQGNKVAARRTKRPRTVNGKEVRGLSKYWVPIYSEHNHTTTNRKPWGECDACDMLTQAEENETNQRAAEALELAQYNDHGIVRWDRSVLNELSRERKK